MIDAIPLLLAPEGYQISRSVRLRSSASAYFNRTPASASNRQVLTWSGWVKRGLLGSQTLFAADNNAGANYCSFFINSSNGMQFNNVVSSAATIIVTTAAVFRDPSAWYHIILAVDTTQATNSNGVKIYVNGVQQTLTFTTYTQNTNTAFNNNVQQRIGALISGADYLDGYLTEVNLVDGQALTPSSFGETNPVTGVWQPKKYTGTYGTNGFYLNFSDNSNNTAATIGKDFSGNGNNWTPNNISVTAGATYDSMLDVPTQWADGGNGRGNYATFNPTIAASTGVGAITNGNLQCVTPTAGASNNYGTIGISSGKWYWEITATARTTDSHIMIGINDNTQSATEFYSQSRGYAYRGNGERWNNGSGVAYGSAAATGDIIGIAFDADAGSLEFFRNGSSMGVAFTGIAASTYFPAICDTGTSVTWTATANFGQRPFAYTPPTGFRALNTLNLPTPTILKGNQYFDATLYTGNGSTLSVTNSGGMQPDLVWLKARSIAESHELQDAVRGATNVLKSNSTAAEITAANTLTSFNSNGFSLSSSTEINTNAATYVGWQWKEGPTQGFDIVTYTGTGTAGLTVNHSLGVAPRMMIVRNRNAVAAWGVYHASLGANDYIVLNTTAAKVTNTMWNNTAPTSSVFTLGGAGFGVNDSGINAVAYLFSEVAGFSRFGSYTGNGSADGPFVFCGFRPRWLMYKNINTLDNWILVDSSRTNSNVVGAVLFPNLSNAEVSAGIIDFVSNGFKIRSAAGGDNGSGNTIIFAAFAETAFKFSLGR